MVGAAAPVIIYINLITILQARQGPVLKKDDVFNHSLPQT